MDYEDLRLTNINKGLIVFNEIDQSDVNNFNEIYESNIVLTDAQIEDINGMLNILFNYITYVPNVYVMADIIKKCFTGEYDYVYDDVTGNILNKLDPETTVRTPFELMDEIFQEIIQPHITNLVFETIRDQEIDEHDIVNSIYNNNSALKLTYINAVPYYINR